MTYSLYDFEMNNNNTISIFEVYCTFDHDTQIQECTYTNQVEGTEISQYSIDEITKLFSGEHSQAYYWLLKVKETGNYYPLPLLTESQKELVLHQLKQLDVVPF